MNVLKTHIAAILMQLVTTLKGVTPALATPDTQAMGSIAQVCIWKLPCHIKKLIQKWIFTPNELS